MGILAQGLGFGSASQAASSSLQFGGAAAGLNTIGTLLSGIGQSQQFGYQAKVASNNSAIEAANAQATLAAGQANESASLLRTGQLIGSQKAAEGANGIDVNIGSAPQVRQSTGTIGALDAALIHYNATREAAGQEATAGTLEAQSSLDKQAASGALFSSLFKGGASVLSGASSLGQRWAGYQLSGAQGTS